MEPLLKERLAANEHTFREVNEGIARGQWPGEEDAPIGFRCECARLGCNLLIAVTLGSFQEVRRNPRRFVVAPGHQLPDLETVVEVNGDYLVVEKRDEAGEAAERLDRES